MAIHCMAAKHGGLMKNKEKKRNFTGKAYGLQTYWLGDLTMPSLITF